MSDQDASSPAGLIPVDIAKALMVAHQASFIALLEEISNLLPPNHMEHPDRRRAISVLRGLADALHHLDKIVGEMDDGTPLVTNHPVAEFLVRLADLFDDLDHGKSPSIFHPTPHASPATLYNADRKMKETLVQTVDVVRQAFGLKSRRQASKHFAKQLEKAGFRLRGHPVRAEFLRIKKHRPGKYRP